MVKAIKEVWTLWEESTGWNGFSRKQKLICVWWSISFVLVLGIGSFWSGVLTLANFAYSTHCIKKYVPVKDDDC